MKSPNVVVSVKEVTSEQQFRKNCQTAATDLYIYIYIYIYFGFCKTQLITSSAELFFSYFEEVNYLKSPNVVVSAKEVTSEQQFGKNCQTAATDLALLHGTSID